MADRSNELRENRPPRREVLLWLPILAGPLGWVLAELVSYSLAPTACWQGSRLLLAAVTPAALLIALSGAVFARVRMRREPAISTVSGEARGSRARFLAIAGFWLCLSFAVAILATGLPVLILEVCD